MKINKYYIAAGVALLVILIVVFTQRSDWDENNFILSADNKGNLTPISEKYFEDEEKRLIKVVNTKLAEISNRVGAVANRVEAVDRALGARINTNANNIRAEANAALQRNRVVAARAEQIDVHYDNLSKKSVYKNTDFHLQNRAKQRNERFGEYNERGGWYAGPNGRTQWFIS